MDKLFNLSTKGLDDLFSTQEQRDEEKLAKIQDIPLALIDPFPEHPFKVLDNEEMVALVESVRVHGVVTPATVTKKPGGRYTLISGHRRKRASELAGLETLRCEVVELTLEEATILMVESNYHRSTILPSEKGFSYKMRLDAMKRQGQRTDLTSAPLAQKSTARAELGKLAGESQDQIRRYIRLTFLIPPLLEQVDAGKLKLRPAVELSYLDEESQRQIAALDKPPSLAQAKELRQRCEMQGPLDAAEIQLAVSSAAPKESPAISMAIRQYIPSSVPPYETEAYICKALEHYQRWLLEQ